MRKLLLGSLSLILLSASILLFQISSQKTVVANNNSIDPLNKMVFIKSGDSFPSEIWIANTDGTKQTKIPINLPAGVVIGYYSVCLTPDGNSIIFDVYTEISKDYRIGYIYRCTTDGTNLRKIVDNTSEASFT